MLTAFGKKKSEGKKSADASRSSSAERLKRSKSEDSLYGPSEGQLVDRLDQQVPIETPAKAGPASPAKGETMSQDKGQDRILPIPESAPDYEPTVMMSRDPYDNTWVMTYNINRRRGDFEADVRGPIRVLIHGGHRVTNPQVEKELLK